MMGSMLYWRCLLDSRRTLNLDMVLDRESPDGGVIALPTELGPHPVLKPDSANLDIRK